MQINTKNIGVIIVITLFLFGGIWFVTSNKDKKPIFEFIVAEKSTIMQVVSTTGKVIPSQSVDLAFEIGGRVRSTHVTIGQHVSPQDILVQLESNDTYALLREAGANVKIQKALLNELVAGLTSEETEIQEIKVRNAQVALEESERNLIVTLRDAETKSDDAIRNKVDQFITNAQSLNPTLDFSIGNAQLENTIEFDRITIESLLIAWRSDSAVLSILSDLKQATTNAKDSLGTIASFLNNVSLIVNTLKTNAQLPQATIDNYRTDISVARTNINTAITAVRSAEEKIQIAQSNLVLEKQQLALQSVGTREEKITAQHAQVEKALANVARRKADLAKTILRSPISGLVTKQNAKKGEIISIKEHIVSLISDTEFEIETFIPEADIAKIESSNTARITLDAYGEDIIFKARIISIEPAATIIEGIATYKTMLQFDEKDDRVRSGMTANIDIKTGMRDNVIVIPARAVIKKDGEKIVRIIQEDTFVEIPITTGLTGSDGTVEIIEGIQEGDEVIIFFESD